MEQDFTAPKPLEARHLNFNHFYGKRPIAIGTGVKRKRAEHTLRTTDLWHKVDFLVNANDVVPGKPNVETCLKAAIQMNTKPESASCLKILSWEQKPQLMPVWIVTFTSQQVDIERCNFKKL